MEGGGRLILTMSLWVLVCVISSGAAGPQLVGGVEGKKKRKSKDVQALEPSNVATKRQAVDGLFQPQQQGNESCL